MRKIRLGVVVVTEYISNAWKIYKKNALSFIAAELIPTVITGLLIFLGFVVFLGSLLPGLDLGMLMNTTDEEVMKGYLTGLLANEGFLSQLGVSAIGFGGFFLIAILVSVYLKIGQVGMAYESLRRRTRVKTMFEVSRKLGFRWIATVLLLSIFGILVSIPLVIVAVFTLGIGVLLIVPFFVLIGPAMVVENSSPFQSIKNSFNSAKKKYLNLLLLCAIYFGGMIIISILGSALSFITLIGWLINMSVGLFVSFAIVPMMRISLVNYYVKNKGASKSGI